MNGRLSDATTSLLLSSELKFGKWLHSFLPNLAGFWHKDQIFDPILHWFLKEGRSGSQSAQEVSANGIIIAGSAGQQH